MSTDRVACANTWTPADVPSIADLVYAQREAERRRAEYELDQDRADALWAICLERNAAHSDFIELCDRVGVNAYGDGEARAIKDVLWAERNAAVLEWRYASYIAMAALTRVSNARKRAHAIYEEVVA